MRLVGLIPSDIAQPGGKETGQRVSHYNAAGGPFKAAFAELEGEGFDALYVELSAFSCSSSGSCRFSCGFRRDRARHSDLMPPTIPI